jgi:ABC-type nitrate/sulfonate/bicarbonate transport system permease component
MAQVMRDQNKDAAYRVVASPVGTRPRPVASAAQVHVGLGVLGIVAVLGMWEMIPRLGLANPLYLPPASSVLHVFAIELTRSHFWVSMGQTIHAWGIGLAIATVLGATVGFALGLSRFLRDATHSTIEFLRPVPSVALIPVAVLLFGTKLESALVIIVYACFWQVLIQVLYGVTDVDPVALDTARSYGFSPLQTLRYVVFPTALPFLFTGLRLASAIALILAITAGLVIGTPGLGSDIALARSGGAVEGLYALVLVTGLIGVAINIGFRQIEKRLLSWHTSSRKDSVT